MGAKAFAKYAFLSIHAYSKTVYGCRRYLNKITKRYDILMVWLPGHSGIPGNYKFGKLARWGTIIELSDEFSNLKISVGTGKLIIDNAIVDSINDRWAAPDTDRTARRIWSRLDEERTMLNYKTTRSVWLSVTLHYRYKCNGPHEALGMDSHLYLSTLYTSLPIWREISTTR